MFAKNEQPLMMEPKLFVCLYVISLIIEVECSNEYKVYQALTKGYDKNVRPIHNSSKTTYVTAHLSYFTLLSMDQLQETISFMSEIVLAWNDEIVKWNETAFAGIEYVVVPASLLWKPDIIISTSLDTNFMMPEDERYVKVEGDGTVTSGSPCIIINQCVLNIEEFPYDIQVCNITLGSWMYDSKQIDLIIGPYIPTDSSERLGNGEWTLLSMEPTLYHYVDGAGINWAEINYVIRLKRQPIYYTCVLLMPTFLSATICLLGLFVPATNKGERIEKVNMGLATLLNMAMILNIVADEMPKTTTLPLLGVYVLAELILCTVGVTLAMIIMVVHQRALTRRWMPPPWLNAIVLFKLKKSKEEKANTCQFYAETRPVKKDKNGNDTVKTIRVASGFERLREVSQRVQQWIDRKLFEDDIELQWIIIFDRIDTYMLIVFTVGNVVMSWWLLFA